MAPTETQFQHRPHIRLKPNKTSPWLYLMGGLTFGVLGVYLSMARPMSSQVSQLTAQLQLMQNQMDLVVGSRDDVWKTNDLLTAIKQQNRQLAEARQTLASMADMHQNIVAQASTIQKSQQMMTQLVSLHEQIAQQSTLNQKSVDVIGQIQQMQSQLASLSSQVEDQMQQMTVASTRVEQMGQLISNMVERSDAIDSAAQMVVEMNELTDSVVATSQGVSESRSALEAMGQLQQMVVNEANMVPVAVDSLNRMVNLQNDLANRDQAQMDQASLNLTSMIKLEQSLAGNTGQLTEAVQTVELLSDFQADLNDRVNTLNRMRKDLVEISLMEQTLTQAINVLKPLSQLTDLRRMSPPEIREAARVILDRRSEYRTATAESIESPVREQSVPEEELVPTPPEFQD